MKALDNTSAELWLGNRGLTLDTHRLISFERGTLSCIEIELGLRVPAHYHAFMLLRQELDTDLDYRGAMVAFRTWNMWDESFEKVGMQLSRRLRGSLGEDRPLEEAPFHLFAQDEFEDAVAILMIPVLCEWDAYVIPDSGKYVVNVSHEEIAYVVSNDEITFKRLLAANEAKAKSRVKVVDVPSYMKGSLNK